MTIIDTSVIIAFLAGDEKIISLLKECQKNGDIKTTTVTEYELLKHKAKLKKDIAQELLSEMTILPFDRTSARKAAMLYEKLKEAGKMVNETDVLIAGISLSNDGEILLTRDKKFSRFGEANIKVV